MKFRNIITIAGIALIIPGIVSARSFKRGVSENQFQFNAQLEVLAPGVSWYYNWGNTAGRNIAEFEGMEFIPMCWNGGFDAAKIREYVAAHPDTRYILGFNEPNFTNQANMTPEEAAAKWPEVRQLAESLGLQLVAPALNYSPNPPYQSPTKWMDEFVALVGNDAFDFTAIHSYGGFNVMKDLATTFHDRYGKPVWVTEFCYWPNEGDPNSYVSPESQIACMIQSVEWLEKTEWIHRYAWFKAVGNSSASKGPNYGLILSGRGEDPRELSRQGYIYTNMSTFDPEIYYTTDKFIPAMNYIDQSGILLDINADTEIDSPLEISQFIAGASVDYQFETITQATSLAIRIGGQGEPVRFDPTIAIFSVNEDGNDGELLSPSKKLTLPGENKPFVTIEFPLSLTPGRHTIRIKDMAPYSPSGILISAVMLQTQSSVDLIEFDSDCDVYTIDGICVARGVSKAAPLANLPVGLYIVDGKKLIKK